MISMNEYKYSFYNLDELKILCRESGIKGYSHKTKIQIINLLIDYDKKNTNNNETEDYNKYTVVELKEICRQNDIKGYSGKKKSQIIDLILDFFDEESGSEDNIKEKEKEKIEQNKEITEKKEDKIYRCFIDVETTGLPNRKGNLYYDPFDFNKYDNSRMIELCYIIADQEGKVKTSYSTLIYPDGFNIDNSDIHGIQEEDLIETGADIDDVFDKFEKDLMDVSCIVSHNIDFDINILLSECYRYHRVNLIKLINDKNIMCTMKMGRKYMDVKKNPKLVELYENLFCEKVDQKHRAQDDTQLCMKCFNKMSDLI